MKKINLSKKILLFLIALVGYMGMKAQTCGSAITLTANTGFTAVDSTNLNLTYYKFTATNTEHGIKFFIKNSNSVKAKCQFKCYTNNCGSLPTSEITSIVSTLGDTFYVDLPSVSTGTVYLIELRNFTPSYLVNRISITNTRYSSRTTNALTCAPSCTTTNACNMVCNGSFECQSLPPFPSISGIYYGYANNWNSPTDGTADLFSTSFPFTGWAQSPCNVFGNQSPQNGNSYAGIIWGESPTDDYTEYLQTQLTNTLTGGVPYTCSMWVRAGDINQAQFGNSQLGIYLTSGPLSISNYTTISLTPNAIETNTTTLNSNIVWKKVVLTFTASGGEDHLIIGRPNGSPMIAISQSTFDCSNFSTAPTTSYVTNFSYLYIDNVSLVPTLTVSANANFPITCSGGQVNLTATSNNGSTTFTWMPGNLTGSSVNVTPTVTTTYTLLGSVSGCSATSTASTTITITVTPQVITTSPSVTICPTFSTVLSASASVAPANFTWMPGSLIGASVAVTPTTTTIYTVTGTAANGCTSTKTVQVTVIIPPGSFSVSASHSLICTNQGQSNSTLTASGTAGLSYTWNPGALNGAVQTVTPSATTIYTATALSGGCIITNTLAVAVQSACCTSTNPNFNGIAFPTTTLVGLTYGTPLVFQNDVTIPTGISVTLSNSEFLFAPNVKLIVSPGSTLQLRGSHLYACGASMWQGIVVQDGGAVNTIVSGGSGNHILIEDAITAVDISNHITSTLTTIASFVTTTFNKNYIAVKVDNYQRNFASNPVYMKECVFSSRQFTFTPTSWPTTSTVSPGLRSATNPTTGLAAPYTLQSAGVVYLKPPYANQTSRIGVQVINSGITSGSNYYGVDLGGVSTSASDFNLFDNLMWGIDATNSNISSINNVFQNAQRIYFCPRCYYDGGTAIRSTINTNLNARVNMTAVGTNSTSYSLGNRFWDCYRAVEANNVYRLNCNYATFRSTQTTASATNPLLTWGSYGITNATNRFEHDIRYNNFNNINNPIAITVAPGTYTYGASTYSGILANNILIDYNYFGAQLTNGTAIGSAFLNNAVYLGSSSSAGWHNIAGLGLRVANNEINRAWRGVYVDAFAYASIVQTNTITLLNDATLNATQRGISANANASAATTIANNKLTGVNITNTLVTLVYVGASPVSGVTCNSLSTSYIGFDFNSSSSGSTWKGNDMTNHARGMVLSNNGIIGTQGAAGAPSDNRWWGSYTGSNYGTYVDASSDAINSKLWVKNSGVFAPQNPSGFFFFQTYAVSTNTPNTTGTYNCGSPPPPQMMMMPPSTGSSNMVSSSGNVSAEELYIAENTTYRYLDANPTVKNSNSTYVNFYNAKANTTIDKFKQVEANLYSGQIAQAQSINNTISITNGVEGNYKSYYNLYAKYKNGNFASADSATLINLAKLCPGIEGSIVYQARALYNLIYKTVKVYTEDCNSALSNGSRLKIDASTSETIKNNWNVELFPNPTKGNFTLVSKEESEVLTVTIMDIAGKLIYKNTVNTSNFIANLELNTKAGVYLITIKNNTNESITKKLVITD
ncbi:MAG: T9SS type A sorting domain-containing protein [Bacteroidota bacterium]|nr:T9SS type A sorting domain-containing protein [Bacteroidota bacterium]